MLRPRIIPSLLIQENGLVKTVNFKKDIRALNFKNKQLVDSRNKYDDIKDEIANVSDVLVDDNGIAYAYFIKKLEKTAEDNEVKLEKNSLSGQEVDGGEDSSYVKPKFLSLKAGGSFDNIMRFLYSLENFSYYIDLEDIEISSGDFDEYNKSMVILESNIKVYQKEK